MALAHGDILRGAPVDKIRGIAKVATLTTVELLRRVPFFGHLSQAQTLALMGEFEKRTFKRSESLVVAGQKSDALYFILSGTANVTVNHSSGRRLVLATLGTGDFVGEMSLLDSEPHIATVIATKQVDVLMLTREGFNFCMHNNVKMAITLMQSLVSRLREAERKIHSLTMFSVHERVARYLLENAVKQEQGQLVVTKKLSHAGIAREVSASREMVSRAIKSFESSSFIKRTESGKLLISTPPPSVANETSAMPGIAE